MPRPTGRRRPKAVDEEDLRAQVWDDEVEAHLLARRRRAMAGEDLRTKVWDGEVEAHPLARKREEGSHRKHRAGPKPAAADRDRRRVRKVEAEAGEDLLAGRKAIAEDRPLGRKRGAAVRARLPGRCKVAGAAHHLGRKREAADRAHPLGPREVVAEDRRLGRKREAVVRAHPLGRCKVVAEAHRSGRKRGAADRAHPLGRCKVVVGVRQLDQGQRREGAGRGLRWGRRPDFRVEVADRAPRGVRKPVVHGLTARRLLVPKREGRDPALALVAGWVAVALRARLPVHTPEGRARVVRTARPSPRETTSRTSRLPARSRRS